jgi:hypothetical protein
MKDKKYNEADAIVLKDSSASVGSPRKAGTRLYDKSASKSYILLDFANAGDTITTLLSAGKLGGSTLDGSGTATYIPKFTDADTLANSSITDDGTKVNIATRIETVGLGNSVFIGEDAGLNDDETDNKNVGIGTDSLKANIGGYQNTALGHSSLYTTIGNYYNTAIGAGSLYNNTANENTAIGFNSLYNNTNGQSNIGVGVQTLNNNQQGKYNIAIGNASLSRNIDGDNNLSIGRLSGGAAVGFNDAGESSIFIGNNTLANANAETNQIVIGHEAIGNGSNTATIGDANITDVYFGSTGVAQINCKRILQGENEFNKSIFIGRNSGLVETNPDIFNVRYNVFIGDEAGKANTTGQDNVFIGHSSGIASISGSGNVGVGLSTLGLSTTGFQNTAIGQGALLSSNGSNNIGIGKGADVNSSTDVNSIIIGTTVVGNGSNTLVLGNDDITDIYCSKSSTAIINAKATKTTLLSGALTNPPTAAELISLIGVCATLGSGYEVNVYDSANAIMYNVNTDGTDWFYVAKTKAV